MNIKEMTYGEVMELKKALLEEGDSSNKNITNSADDHVGEKVIVRTYSAGVWFGTIAKKSHDEVILVNARRLWKWHCREGICLASLAAKGIIAEKCRISHVTAKTWLQAIEIHSPDPLVISEIENCPPTGKE